MKKSEELSCFEVLGLPGRFGGRFRITLRINMMCSVAKINYSGIEPPPPLSSS